MDILGFINSKDVRKHLQEIGYEFNSLETAWLIYHNRKLTHAEKKGAWQELIDTMPDCAIEERNWCEPWESLHEFLRTYISIMDREIEFFYQEEQMGFIYMYVPHYKSRYASRNTFQPVYSSVGSFKEAFDEEIAEEDDRIANYWIKKQSLADPEYMLILECNPYGQVMNVIGNTFRSDEEDKVVVNSFDGMWFDIPTPFKAGDIVKSPEVTYVTGCQDEVFVLKGISTWNASEEMRKCGDMSDMGAGGYMVESNGFVYNDHLTGDDTYLDLEFYEGDFEGADRMLSVIGRYMKEELTLDYLLNITRLIAMNAAADKSQFKQCYPKEIYSEDADLIGK